MVQHQTGSAATNQSGDLHRLVFVFVEALHFFSSFLHWREYWLVCCCCQYSRPLKPLAWRAGLSGSVAVTSSVNPSAINRTAMSAETMWQCAEIIDHSVGVCGRQCKKKKNKNMLQHVGSGLVQSADSRVCTHIKWTPRHTFTKRAGRGREHVYYYLEKGWKQFSDGEQQHIAKVELAMVGRSAPHLPPWHQTVMSMIQTQTWHPWTPKKTAAFV